MSAEASPEFRYQPVRCRFLQKTVWSIVVQGPDGGYRTVNCLDKDHGCFDVDCGFTKDGGEWPFEGSPGPVQTSPIPSTPS